MSALTKAKKTNKIRFNLTLSRSAVAAGRKLAKSEKRSFSNTLEVLIERASLQQKAAA